MMRLTVSALLAALVAAFCLHASPRAQSLVPPVAQVDAVFAKWTRATPGCAVGVSESGRPVLEKGYGTADLEHDVPITGSTIFEAGSVSKQFTAAAVLLLARDGKLSLDDPATRLIPELAGYGDRITIRHMLTHTSGLRDWGTEEAIAGWPRTTRVYTHAHVLDLVSRQRALNFDPGSNWSYSNTGYNLAAVLVARSSGESFAEFCRRRLFGPLELEHTSWRDDYTRVVKGRAIAYSRAKDGYHADMPFENVHGNGGLLTTVGDLLRWNAHYDAPSKADAAIVRQQQEPARLSSGHALDYSLGLFVQRYRQFVEVGHGGATAGYRAYLARYPERRLSVAVLCNAADATPDRYAHAVADIFLGVGANASGETAPADAAAAVRDAPGVSRMQRPADVVQATDTGAAPTAAAGKAPRDDRSGLYRHQVTGHAITIAAMKDGPTADGRPLRATGTGSSLALVGSGAIFDFNDSGGLDVRLSNGLVERYRRVPAAQPTADQLRGYEGIYTSDEAEAEFGVFVKDGLWLLRRPDTRIALRPLYADAFSAAGLGTIIFRRDEGRVAGFSVVTDRVWDLHFKRISAPAPAPAR